MKQQVKQIDSGYQRYDPSVVTGQHASGEKINFVE